MQVLRLLAARRGAATTITAPWGTAAPEAGDDRKAVVDEEEEEEAYDDDDEGSFFELDLSVRASSSSAGSAGSSGSSDDSDDASSSSLTDLDFVISLHRSCDSASPSSFHFPAVPTTTLPLLDLKPGSSGGGSNLRTLSFAGATAKTRNAAAALYGGRRSSSFARTSAGTARSLRLFMESAADADEDPVPEPRRAPSRDVIRRYLTKISTRLRRSMRPGRRGGGEGGGFRRLRKSRSASAAVTPTTTAASRRDDSLAEKQDGIASAIAHCKESFHRASLSLSMPDCGSPLPRSLSDPGSRQAP